jgi:hypothetical protein
MATISVSLSFDSVNNKVVVNNNVETLDKDQQIEFIATDSNYYTVIIDQASIYFNTTKNLLTYDVSKFNDSISVTPTTKPNVSSSGLIYTVICYTADNAFRNETNAPPKIIIISHT